MSIKVNMQITGNEPAKVNKENFPRLFDGNKQVSEMSVIYTDNGIDIQTTIDSTDILVKSLNTWTKAEETKLNKQLAEIQRKLAILKSIQ